MSVGIGSTSLLGPEGLYCLLAASSDLLTATISVPADADISSPILSLVIVGSTFFDLGTVLTNPSALLRSRHSLRSLAFEPVYFM